MCVKEYTENLFIGRGPPVKTGFCFFNHFIINLSTKIYKCTWFTPR
jgi:hypothetical protein